MPVAHKREFVLELLKTFENIFLKKGSLFEVYIFDDSKDDLQNTLELDKGQITKRWYIFDQEKFFYSETGNKKIQRA